MEKVKEISQKEKEMEAEKAFRATPLGKNITELEGHVENHLVDMLDAVGIGVTDEQRTDMMTNFIAASHAAGTIQRLVWQQMDFEAKQREAMQTTKAEKIVKKAAKKEAVKKNRSRGKTSMKKA
tara:strand:- start:188 stop:559 length:372 start_codon:yes stop_codon:yes gene_type:complete